jgi:hypothetical protein
MKKAPHYSKRTSKKAPHYSKRTSKKAPHYSKRTISGSSSESIRAFPLPFFAWLGCVWGSSSLRSRANKQKHSEISLMLANDYRRHKAVYGSRTTLSVAHY